MNLEEATILQSKKTKYALISIICLLILSASYLSYSWYVTDDDVSISLVSEFNKFQKPQWPKIIYGRSSKFNKPAIQLVNIETPLVHKNEGDLSPYYFSLCYHRGQDVAIIKIMDHVINLTADLENYDTEVILELDVEGFEAEVRPIFPKGGFKAQMRNLGLPSGFEIPAVAKCNRFDLFIKFNKINLLLFKMHAA